MIVADPRRRSLSRLGLTLLANYGSKEAINSAIASTSAQTLSTDAVFRCSRNVIVPRSRLQSAMVAENGAAAAASSSSAAATSHNGDNTSALHVKEANAACASSNSSGGSSGGGAPRTKPPSILVYTGDRADLYRRIAASLSAILAADVYTLTHVSTHALRAHPWIDESAACLLVAETKQLDDPAWQRIQTYFVHVRFCFSLLAYAISVLWHFILGRQTFICVPK